MNEPLPPWLANLDPRWVRPDWKKWVRPDWQSFMPPGMRFDAQPAPRSEFERLYKPYRDEPPSPPPPRATGPSDILALRSELSALRFKLALIKWRLKAGFDPDQPRVPAGNLDGGQWTSEGGIGSVSVGHDDSRVVSDATPDVWTPGALYAQDEMKRYSVDLKDEEHSGGHTIEKHIGKTDNELLDVLRRNYHVGFVYYQYQDAEGSFSSVEAANDFVNRVLEDNKAAVDLVASGREDGATLERRFGFVTGKEEAFRPDVNSEPYIRDTYAVRVRIA